MKKITIIRIAACLLIWSAGIYIWSDVRELGYHYDIRTGIKFVNSRKWLTDIVSISILFLSVVSGFVALLGLSESINIWNEIFGNKESNQDEVSDDEQ